MVTQFLGNSHAAYGPQLWNVDMRQRTWLPKGRLQLKSKTVWELCTVVTIENKTGNYQATVYGSGFRVQGYDPNNGEPQMENHTENPM